MLSGLDVFASSSKSPYYYRMLEGKTLMFLKINFFLYFSTGIKFMDRLPVASFTKHAATDSVCGIFEREAFRDTKILQYLNSFVVNSKIEQHPEATGEIDDPKSWNIDYIKNLPNEKLHLVIKSFQHSMYSGWYSLFWDMTSYYVFFPNGVAILTYSSTITDTTQVDALARSNGLNPAYMLEYLNRGIIDFNTLAN